MTAIVEIELLADSCARTDYGDPKSVRAHNRAADRIRELIAQVATGQEYLALLQSTNAKGWVAFQLLEQPDHVPGPVRNAACNVLREIAAAGGPAGLAASWRLEELGEES